MNDDTKERDNVKVVESLTGSLRDLDKFTPILDHCGASYGLSYRAVLEHLRAAIEGTEADA